MAVTTERSTTLQVQEGTLSTTLGSLSLGLRDETIPVDFTQSAAAGDATSTTGLVRLRPGLLKLKQMTFVTSAFGASRTLTFGHEAYTNMANATVAASAAAFKAATDVSAAATTVVTVNQDLNSLNGIVINATVAGGTIPAGATIKGWVSYSYPG